MFRVLFLLQSAFSLWMLVDAMRRGAERYWYMVVLFPFGEWVYFFKVKIHDPEFAWLRQAYTGLTTPKTSLEQLRYQAKESPSYQNILTLAQALHDQESYREAEELFDQALGLSNDSVEALYGLASSRVGIGKYEDAIAPLEQVIERNPKFSDYIAYSDLAHALSHTDRTDEALDLLNGLVQKSPQLPHRVLYAHYLSNSGKREAAAEQLRQGLLEHQNAPKFLRKKHRSWVRRAKQMQQHLAHG